MVKRAVFPGSFDPFTKGHYDILLRSLDLFDEIIVGIGVNSTKTRFFPVEKLIPKLEELFKDQSRIKVMKYEGLTAMFAKSVDAKFLIRGLRNTTDYEYETSIAQANKYIWAELETVFLTTSSEYSHLSSTIIREIYKFGGNVDQFLPYKI